MVPLLFLSFPACGVLNRALKLDKPYLGPPMIIFRLDDAEKGAYEEIIDKIIRVFKINNVPLDVGVIPYAKGRFTYDMPYLKKYLDEGVIDLTVHAFQHSYREFDTHHSRKSYHELKSGLIKSRQLMEEYYGVAPVSFSVPYDFFTRESFNAIRDAGFTIFTTQMAVEKQPSIFKVDFNGKEDETGVFRLCTVDDVATWDNDKQQWGGIQNPGSDLQYSINWGLERLGVAIVNVHPQSFLDKRNRVIPRKLHKLNVIVKWSRQFGEVTTFERWHKFANARPPI